MGQSRIKATGSDRADTRDEAEISCLIAELESFRSHCRVTTLAEIEPSTRSAFRLLVSCVISLRTKDQVTREASDRLFRCIRSPSDLAALPETAIADAIYPAGFYRTKSRQLREIARLVESRHGGVVPSSEEHLLALPGVGRKTANLVRGLGFAIPAICVDTHVHRISNRLGLVATSTPEATEKALQKVLPRDLWIPVNDLMVTFGQNQCLPVSPLCNSCPLDEQCPRAGVERHR